ncbi:MAG TPA: xanthine dehydrogenase family protein molybdopterin-binding subunit [Paraburkholderia sp.]
MKITHIGRRVLRTEDVPLLRGEGRYVSDIELPDMLHVAFIRSPYAHALIRSIDTSRALEINGVVAVVTAAEIAGFVAKPRMPLGFPTRELPPNITPWLLTPEEVCFVGEAVAMVLATSRYIAEDAAAVIEVDYEPLDVLSDCRDALDPAAPKVRREAADNVLTRFRVGYGDCDEAFASAAHVFGVSLHQHRGGAHPMEGRGVVAHYEDHHRMLTVWSSTQMTHELQFTLAEVLGIPETRLRVIAPDVGGGFGAKYLVYPEELAVAAVAMHFRKPVKWIEDRGEHFVSAIQERDQYWDVEIAVTDDARILGVRGTMVHDQGAYTPQGINCPYNAATGVTGPYMVPAYDLFVSVAQTNKVYTIPVRGAGYPEGAFTMERLLDKVARELRLDRAEVRRRNLVPPEKMPYVKPLKARSGKPITLESGNYHDAQRRVLEAIDYAGFEKRRAEARREGRYIGIGLSNATKGTGRGPFESAIVKVSSTGRVSVSTGAMAMGQGLHTALAQIVATQLGIGVEDIEVTSGNSTTISMGLGGFASRQTVTAGSSTLLAAQDVAAKLRRVGAQLLKVEVDAVELANGRVFVRDEPDRSVSFADLGRLLRGIPGYDLPPGAGAGIESTRYWEPDAMAYANASHACEVEVDIGTGEVRLLRYVALHDCGRIINPMIAEGQVHGSIVHGIGNALFEFMRYDEQGQPQSTTFADYLLPTSTEIPHLELIFVESPSTTNPLGVKGIGEVGTVPVTSCVASAIDDAMADFNVEVRAIPVSPVHLVEQMDAADPDTARFR